MASQKPIIVIVPGGFHKPIHYRKITALLRSQGHEVIPYDLASCGDTVDPEVTFIDEAAEIQEKLLPLLDGGREAVIFSHSYGSLPATHATEGLTAFERAEMGLKGGIIGVVNLAGFAFPARGKGIMGDETIVPPTPYQFVEVSLFFGIRN
jgi:alpha-beta hydrolase superfamily lysophospholipase